MPQLKIQISDWVLESAPAENYVPFGAEEFEAVAARIVDRAAARSADVGDYDEAVRAYEEEFGAELDGILKRGGSPFSAAGADAVRTPRTVDWNAILVGGPTAEGAARDLAADLVAAVVTAASQDDPVVPRVFLARGHLPPGVARALRQDPGTHETWRRGLATAESLLMSLGDWCGSVLASDQAGSTAHIGRARAELQSFGDRIEVSRKVGIPGVEFSIPVDPPLHLLDGLPLYDNEDLAIRVIPFVADLVAAGCLRQEPGLEVLAGGSTIVLKGWRRTENKDLERLGRTFARLRDAVRRPAAAEAEDSTAPDLGPYLVRLGCRCIVGAPECWRTSGDCVVGVRPVDHYRDGLRAERRLQICVVLGAVGGEPPRPDLLDMLTCRGTISHWTDAGLAFIGLETDMPGDEEDLRNDLEGFVALASEVRIRMHRDGAVGEMLTAGMLTAPGDENDLANRWIVALKSLPVRLEVDFERMRRRWRRERLVDEVRLRLEEDALDIARGLVAAVQNEDDRNHVRAALVVHLFGRDADGALDELDRLEFGAARHEAVVAVLETAAEKDARDALEIVFGKWLNSDARRFDYDSDCTPLLEVVAGGLGLGAIHAGYPEETAPPVACDWLNFVFRRSPRSRRDLEWLARLDLLTNDEVGLYGLHLDRLANLFVAQRRYDLPGRQAVIAAIRVKAAASPYRAYYEDLLGVSLHSPLPGDAT